MTSAFTECRTALDITSVAGGGAVCTGCAPPLFRIFPNTRERDHCMIRSFAIAAAMFSAVAISSHASAASAPGSLATSPSSIIDIQYGDKDRGHKGDRDADKDRGHKGDRDRDHRRRYNPGGRYDSAPPRWRRYDRHPGDWRRRGCIIVGPLWFCP